MVVPYGSSHLLKVLEQGVRAGLPVLVEVRTTLPPESCSAASPWQLLSLHTTSDESSRAWDGIGVQLLTLHVYILHTANTLGDVPFLHMSTMHILVHHCTHT